MTELTGTINEATLFDEDGFLPLPSFFASEELVELDGEVETVLTRPLPPGCVRPNNTLIPLRWNDPLIALTLGSDDRIEAIQTAVQAQDLRWISGYISLKEPQTPALWWHQDWWCWTHPATFRRQAIQVAVLCYLTETGPDSGALRVLPGSHHRSFALHHLLPEAHANPETLSRAHPAMSDHECQVTIQASSGDAVVLDYRILHGTHPNERSSRRVGLILNFTPSWSELPTDIRAHLIRHPSQPGPSVLPDDNVARRFLPTFDGTPRDLSLHRDAPASFTVHSA